MSSRAWIKVYCDKWFAGSIRKESPLLRSIWVDILALAGRTGDGGTICLPGTSTGYTDHQLAAIFNVPPDDWLQVKERLSNHPDPSENRIRVTSENVIEIINWKTYQSEYCRQKSYRQKLQGGVTPESDTQRCAEKEKEKENRKEVDLKDQKQGQDRVHRPKGNGRFTPPSLQEVMEYCRLHNSPIDPVRFHSHYTANGWRVGKNPMKNWKAAVVTWERMQ